MIVRWNFCSTIRSLVRSFSWRLGEKKCEQRLCANLGKGGCNVGVLCRRAERTSFDPIPHHPLDHLNELSARQLDPFRVSFDPDQAASLGVLGDSHRHFVLLLDPIDCRQVGQE